jgi:glycosyltransferase involved in cell wall biosynthesis
VLATVNYPATPHGARARLLFRLGALLCDRVVCVSQAVERSWFGATGGRTIHNAVDVEAIDRAMGAGAEAPRGAGGPWIGTVSRLSAEKGIDLLLEAFARLAATRPQARLRVVGDGAERERLAQQARALGVADRVEWVGARPWDEAVRELAGMDVVVVPSRFEGFGLCALEAMACARPVVAARVGGLPEIVEDGRTGVLAPPGDSTALAAAVSRLLDRPQLGVEMGKRGRRRAETMFSIGLFNARYRSLYSGLLEGRTALA